MLQVYDRIGIAGVVLIVLSFASLYYFLKTAFFLRWVMKDFRAFFGLMERGEIELLEQPVDEVTNPLVVIMRSIASAPASRLKDIGSEVTFLFHRNFGGTNVALTVLRLISVLSPLLGLMGTVLGIARVFRNIATQAVVNNTVLAGGIWEALITTIMGLSVAIPTLVFYYVLRLRVRGLMIESVEYAQRVVDIARPGED